MMMHPFLGSGFFNAPTVLKNRFRPPLHPPENLFEGLLFDTVKGTFTNAMDKKGLFEAGQRRHALSG
jgi:hypothetical protein